MTAVCKELLRKQEEKDELANKNDRFYVSSTARKEEFLSMAREVNTMVWELDDAFSMMVTGSGSCLIRNYGGKIYRITHLTFVGVDNHTAILKTLHGIYHAKVKSISNFFRWLGDATKVKICNTEHFMGKRYEDERRMIFRTCFDKDDLYCSFGMEYQDALYWDNSRKNYWACCFGFSDVKQLTAEMDAICEEDLKVVKQNRKSYNDSFYDLISNKEWMDKFFEKRVVEFVGSDDDESVDDVDDGDGISKEYLEASEKLKAQYEKIGLDSKPVMIVEPIDYTLGYINIK